MLITEVPEPIEVDCCDGGWYALQTSDQPAVLEAFGLSDSMPVTMRLGVDAWMRGCVDAWMHDDAAFDPKDRAGARVFVSPALDGWTLVFGERSDEQAFADRSLAEAVPIGPASRIEFIEKLNAQFGRASWYQNMVNVRGWCTSEGGDVVRCYFGREFDEEVEPQPEWDETLAAASRCSLDISKIGPHTRVEGHAVIALTARGRRDGTPSGALLI